MEIVLGMMAIPALGLGIVAFAIWRDRSATYQIENGLPSTAVVRSIDETMQRILMSDPLADWWHGDTPLKG